MMPQNFTNKSQEAIQTAQGIANENGQPQAEYIERINHGIKSANLPSAYVQKSIRPFIPES